MTEKEMTKYYNYMAKQSIKFFCKHQANMGDNNEIAKTLIDFLNKHGIVFAFSQGEEQRNFLKWALSENIKHNQLLLDKIIETESKYKVPTETQD